MKDISNNNPEDQDYKTGVLILNLGTPEKPTPEAVGRYLREFLMDPLVVDIPWLLRWILVQVLIVPRRRHQSARLYQKVWTETGSPLLVLSQKFVDRLSLELGSRFAVRLAMRYGQPSVSQALELLRKDKQVKHLFILPMYPQYSLAATESCVVKVKDELNRMGWDIPYSFLPAFYDRHEFLCAVASVAKPELERFNPDHTVFSFHGLPERQVKKLDTSGHGCSQRTDCCDQIIAGNADCYRAQSYATARCLARELELNPKSYSVAFQSRLGRTPWIRPYSDEVYEDLAKKGIRRVAVLCPSFVTDCLETLEEVAIRGNEAFQEAGGGELRLISCLNDSLAWVKVVADWVKVERRGAPPDLKSAVRHSHHLQLSP